MKKLDREKITPAELARRWGIDPSKVIAWIKTGELRAINAAVSPHGRPRYLIDQADLEDFERSRATLPPARQNHRQPPGFKVRKFL